MKLSNDVRALFAGIAVVAIASLAKVATPNVVWLQPVWNVVDVVMYALLSTALILGLFILIRGAITGKV
jgi:hypothetical protein